VKDEKVTFLWQDAKSVARFAAGVCLHGHTMHSLECLSFLPRYLHLVPGISLAVSRYERGPKPRVDFSRAYWTPPLTPASALKLERDQIAAMGLRALVSLTDHDNIEAGMGLQLTTEPSQAPVSVEWTVPYERSILHLGIHNLPPASARHWLSTMASYTSSPDEHRLPATLSECARMPEVLIVLNHPFWLEEGIEEENHRKALVRFLKKCIPWIHALEWNGTRTWSENAAVMELARACSRPLISGGDRHAGEPAACLNLTNARCFAEFVSEIRDGCSSVVVMPHYREPMPLRVLEAAWDILRPYPEYAGRERWTDRFFYQADEGDLRPLSALWGDRVPWILKPATGAVQLFAAGGMRGALRFLLSRRAEVLP
jgi:hypothetical protein